ncbi:gliding motility-associated C-terminal domain-containing protein [Chitinophaga filiformis]|uniref:Gliding motility-associated C-terminal domain-containing protein n=1 Tax=Chitinophaga filiformis TaxID=104663 RepID=A0ABY4IAT9_CHIFI|nr:gliding motility-associated C-terminal domain-containing protein [Chitinophaga filiformis]UPK72763.1 gliding motility-associated C-terminal domain-containing protein [Chitinophaga filiformis]
MKVFVRLSRQWSTVCRRCSFLVGGKRITRTGLQFLCCLFIAGVSAHSATAQDIPLTNPSLEDKPKDNKAPKGWLIAAQTPDVQPGMYKVFVPPTDGNSYVGLHSGPGYLEGIAQELATVMRGGRSYTMSLDLAYYAAYVYRGCYGNVSVYGGNTPSDTAELLWNSGDFYHTGWQRYAVSLNPSADYKYLSIYATVSTAPCTSKYGVVALIDNLSPQLSEAPQISIAATNTCKGGNTGNISVNVTAGTAPFTYQWLPGGETGSRLSHLAAGDYQVTVTAANGLKVSGKVSIGESDLESAFTVTGALCNGDDQNLLQIHTTGGQPPYRYYLNNADQGVSTPLFYHLRAGNYTVKVEDGNGCYNKLENIRVTEPPALSLQQVSIKNTSCGNVQDGRIILMAEGGTPPYLYSIPAKHITQADSILQQLEAGWYRFAVSDSHGCTVEGQAGIEMESRDCAVYIPTAFSPNRDGINDVFRAKVNDAVTEFRLAVYGRWGNLVFETNDPDTGWDGAQKGTFLPVGSYVWMLTYTDSRKQGIKQQGTLVLIR